MSLHRNTQEVIKTIEHSDYLAVLGSLLVGFVIAWTIRQPGFQDSSVYDMHGTAPQLARDLPALIEGEETPTPTYGEFQPLIETTPAPETVERNSKLPRPELFTKTTPTAGGMLLSFSVTNFTIGTDGYLVLQQNDTEVTKVFASPYFIDEDMLLPEDELQLQLVTPEGKYITTAGTLFAEKITK